MIPKNIQNNREIHHLKAWFREYFTCETKVVAKWETEWKGINGESLHDASLSHYRSVRNQGWPSLYMSFSHKLWLLLWAKG